MAKEKYISDKEQKGLYTVEDSDGKSKTYDQSTQTVAFEQTVPEDVSRQKIESFYATSEELDELTEKAELSIEVTEAEIDLIEKREDELELLPENDPLSIDYDPKFEEEPEPEEPESEDEPSIEDEVNIDDKKDELNAMYDEIDL